MCLNCSNLCNWISASISLIWGMFWLVWIKILKYSWNTVVWNCPYWSSFWTERTWIWWKSTSLSKINMDWSSDLLKKVTSLTRNVSMISLMHLFNSFWTKYTSWDERGSIGEEENKFWRKEGGSSSWKRGRRSLLIRKGFENFFMDLRIRLFGLQRNGSINIGNSGHVSLELAKEIRKMSRIVEKSVYSIPASWFVDDISTAVPPLF